MKSGRSLSKPLPKKVSRPTVKRKNDLIELILHDHKALKALIKVMKNSDLELKTRQAALEEFCPLLTSHAKPEEEDELLPYFRRETDLEQRIEMGNEYLDKKATLLADGGDDSPSENEVPEKSKRQNQGEDEEDENPRIGAVAY